MLMRRLAAFAALWTIVAALLVAPGTATAATSSSLDLVATSGVQTHVHLSQIGSLFGVEPGEYLYGTGSTGMNAVTEHIIAPGGTELDPTSLAVPDCTWVTPKIEAWCVLQGEEVQQGNGPTFYGQLMRLKFLSVPVTPGLYEVQCACDSNPSNNRVPITFIIDDPTPDPTPRAAATTPAATTPTAHPTKAQPTAASHSTTAMPGVTAGPTASASASAGTEVVTPDPSSTLPTAAAQPSVIDLAQAPVTEHHTSITTPIMIVLSAVLVAGSVVGTMILLRRRRTTR